MHFDKDCHIAIYTVFSILKNFISHHKWLTEGFTFGFCFQFVVHIPNLSHHTQKPTPVSRNFGVPGWYIFATTKSTRNDAFHSLFS